MDILQTNFLAMMLHGLFATGLLVAYAKTPAAHSRSNVSIYRSQISGPTDTTCTTDTPVNPSQCDIRIPYSKPREVLSVNIVYGAAAFFIVTAFAHLYYGTDGFGTGSYTRNLKEGWNPTRWLEYGVSASLMSVLIGLVDGTNDVGSLASVVFMTIAMQMCGYAAESQMRGTSQLTMFSKDTVLAATYTGFLLYLGIWVNLIYNFVNIVDDVKTKFSGTLDSGGNVIKVPAWIWAIVILQAIYYLLFGLAQMNHVAKRFSGQAYNFLETEKAFIGLSFTAKLSLAGAIGYGAIMRTKNC